MYKIHLGLPEMKELWDHLCHKAKEGTASKCLTDPCQTNS